MNSLKERKVFSLSNFRGLDKENKAVKVSKQRASDGLNFVLDSDTLKTRPAFRFHEKTPFFPENNEYVIGWHEFNNVIFYVTNKHFYIHDGDLVFNETESPTIGGLGVFIKSVFQTLNFNGKEPIFREEKSSLFIFGLGAIYVFSVISSLDLSSTRYVLYELSQKPVNPFSINNDFYSLFDALPYPYVPTILIGDNAFEDVNLLSNTVRYRLFANVGNAIDGKNVYLLPTHFKNSKHSGFTPKIEFYKERFQGLTEFPIFMGVLGEDFESTTPFGSIPSGFQAIKVEGTYFPKADFQYFGSSTSFTVISEEYKMDRKTLFNMRLSTGQSVFEYLMNYILTNSITSNRVLYFEVKAKPRCVFKNVTTNYIDEIKVIDKTINIYVQIKKYNNLTFGLLSEQTLSSAQVYEEDTSEAYPSYPSISPIVPDKTFNMGTILKNNYTSADFRNLCSSYLFNNQDDVDAGDVVHLYGKMYYNENKTVSPSVNLAARSLWSVGAEDTNIIYNDFSSITDGNGANEYPSFSNPNGYPVVEFDSPIDYNGFTFNFSVGSSLYNAIKNAILFLISSPSLVLHSGNAFAKLKIQTQYVYDTRENYFEGDGEIETFLKGISIVVPFSYQKPGSYTFQVRQSFSYTCTISKESQAIVDDLYRFELSDDEAFFKFTLNDYFFDYNNEPSIEIAVSFTNNPDYNMISGCNFGVNFGSENRLFLAGHPSFPNIDRYNVSNDLLGQNKENQSYELSYFPSKNYRVVGGKGAINGYVVGTDTQLYVTKSYYPNDNVLFVRVRHIDENGVVSYQEIKTNVGKTPLNHKCIVRFYNDIVIVSKDGVFAIELSDNVLTSERLLKLRSGFINKDIVASIKKVSQEEVFVVEDNNYMYIFAGNDVYVADSRYIAQNPNSVIENYSYEFVKWHTPTLYSQGKETDKGIVFLGKNSSIFYKMQDNDNDEVSSSHQNALSIFDIYYDGDSSGKNAFVLPYSFNYIFENPGKYSFRFKDVFRIVGRLSFEYHWNGNRCVFDNNLAFVYFADGDTLYFKDSTTGVFWPFVISNFSSTGFDVPLSTPGNRATIYASVANIPMYIESVFSTFDGVGVCFRLTQYKPSFVGTMEPNGEETESGYFNRLLDFLIGYNDYEFYNDNLLDVLITEENPIDVLWLSAITDFDNSLFEKTMYRLNFYATRKQSENNLYFGYKTMRRLKTLEDQTEITVTKQIDLASSFDFGGVDLDTFTLNTFNEFGVSIPAKENNFLYVQFIILARGQIELNSIEIFYKLNRMLKTIG